MYRSFITLSLLSATLSATSLCFATDLQTQGLMTKGSIPIKIKLNNQEDKIIQLMKIDLSDSVKEALSNNLMTIMTASAKPILNANLAPQVYLGMNNEPVLDQGRWGTCATFATTGAINALYSLKENQRVSQLCNLELGKTLNNPPSADGGWDGSWGYIILQQMNQYGYLPLSYQNTEGCGGLKDYPLRSTNNGQAMPITEFTAQSVKKFSSADWNYILHYEGKFSPIPIAEAEKVLDNVKKSLSAGNRVTFGTLLDPYVGNAGALGSFNGFKNDTWVLTPKITQDVKSGRIAGHEIIIDGYDDNACATYLGEDNKTQKQCGLLRIRNSWGDYAGDHGDYYVSYDHFKGMVLEAYAIGKTS